MRGQAVSEWREQWLAMWAGIGWLARTDGILRWFERLLLAAHNADQGQRAALDNLQVDVGHIKHWLKQWGRLQT